MKNNIPSDSMTKRYLFSLGANLTRLLFGFVTAGLVPRALGPVNYGNLQFLTSSLNSIRNFLDFGTSSAFFTRSSQKLKTDISILIYSGLLSIQAIFIILLIFLGKVTGYASFLWPDQELFLIWIVAGLIFIQFMRSQMIDFGDAKGLTVLVKSINLFCEVGMVFLILGLFFANRLNLRSFISINYIVSIIFIIVAACIVFWPRREILFAINRSRAEMKASLSYFRNYCSPLVVYTFIGFLSGFFERWFLQLTGGSREQGYYSLSFAWSTVILVFTTSIITIYWKEISSSFARKDIERVKYLYKKSLFLLYSVAAYIAIFLFSNAKILVTHIAGEKYMAAIIPFMIMTFYPVHQTYGQLNGSFYLATERTRTYRTIGISGMFLSIIAVYVLLAPKEFTIPGMNLGALGLAIKMVGIQFIFVNIQLFVNCKFLNIGYIVFLFHQAGIILLWGIASIISRFTVGYFLSVSGTNSVVTRLILDGVLYSVLVGAVVFSFPKLVGMSRSELKNRLASIRKIFSKG